MTVFLNGFLLMASVIFAVGPQNAMLIRCGLRREHPYLLAAIFTLCDALLIGLGVLGVGRIIAETEWLKLTFTIGGAAFLFWFSARAFHSAWKGGQDITKANFTSRGSLIATALAVSLLNPGAIIDTVVIVGTVSSRMPFEDAILFGLGAQTFSSLYFFAVAAFTHRVANLFSNPLAWRIIDGAVGAITFAVGLHLLRDLW